MGYEGGNEKGRRKIAEGRPLVQQQQLHRASGEEEVVGKYGIILPRCNMWFNFFFRIYAFWKTKVSLGM